MLLHTQLEGDSCVVVVVTFPKHGALYINIKYIKTAVVSISSFQPQHSTTSSCYDNIPHHQKMTSSNFLSMSSTRLTALVQDFRANVIVKDTRHHLIKYRNCFIGKEAVNWLVTTEYAKTRQEAVKVGNTLFKLGVFSHVRNDRKFEDSNLFYRLADHINPELRPQPTSQRGIALVAHNNMKKQLIQWAKENQEPLSHHRLVATGTTGSLISKETGLAIELMKSGPLGGDQQIGACIADDKIDTLIFFWDPLTAQPHDADVKALLRLAVLYNVSIAMNVSTANALIPSCN